MTSAIPRAIQVPWHLRLGIGSVSATVNTLGLHKPFLQAVSRRFADNFKDPKHFGNFRASESDTFAACFGKSGTTWLTQVMYQIAWRGEGEYAHINDVVPWPEGKKFFRYALTLDEQHKDPQYRSPTGLHVIKTHMMSSLIRNSQHSKFVTLHRDPKEMIVSLYPFLTDAYGLNRSGVTLHEFVEMFIHARRTFENMATFTTHYWRLRNEPNFLFMNYADMNLDPGAHILKVADIMGVELSQDEFEKVCEKSTFKYMKGIKHKFRPPHLHFGRPPDIIRSGKSGAVREELSEELCERVDVLCRDLFRSADPEFPYDELYCQGVVAKAADGKPAAGKPVGRVVSPL